MIVLDASVFVKVIHEEDGSDRARTLLEHASRGAFELLAPGVMKYEALGAALHYSVPFGNVLSLFEIMQASGFAFVEPSADEILLAEEIATMPVPGGGYAELFDAIYHAVALSRGGTFVTADQRHIRKAGHLGAVRLLTDWQPD